ncbi:MAG: hypothetical protein A3F10_03660 [Coxiella sp. RIFCSPHIGHO2_12_FULL_42_15]|nr:MAG: hypothetical protein A3F10_03660 [Coxiella sp. RIFCSPHIGHO2_12_FULL_42_15]
MWNRPFEKQSGAALITALMMMALCSVLAVFLLLGQRLLIQQVTLANTSDRLTLTLQEVQNWGMGVLKQGKDIRKIRAYHVNDNGIHVSGMIYALGGRLNVNGLQDTENIPLLAALLQHVTKMADQHQAQHIAMQIARWMVPSNQTDKYYLAQRPPYRAASQPLLFLSELRLIKGMTAPLYAALVSEKQPYLVALPTNTMQIDVNYASVPVLMSVLNISEAEAQSIVSCRHHSELFTSVSDFMKQCGINRLLDLHHLTTTNSYYLITGVAQQNEQRLLMQSFVQINSVDNKLAATLLWQEYNGE